MKFNIFKNKNILNNQKGFTLLEMIISLAIFTIVAVVAVGALLKILDANRKSLTLKTAINNINFALESMSREMRVGRVYSCGTSENGNFSAITNNSFNTNYNCSNFTLDVSNGNDENGSWRFAFRSSKKDPSDSNCNLIYAYKMVTVDNGKRLTLKKAMQNTCQQSLNDQDYYDVISPDVNITKSFINVSGNSSQPYASFTFEGYVGVKEKDKTYFNIKTSVAQRVK